MKDQRRNSTQIGLFLTNESAKLERHRGDRYYGSNNNSNYYNGSSNQEYHYSRHNRPSRFSDGPETNRYNNNNLDSYQYNRRRSPSEFRVDVGGRGGAHQPFDSPPRRALGTEGGFRPMSVGGGGGGGGGRGGLRPMGRGFEPGSNYPVQPPPPVAQLLGQKRGFLGRGGVSPG